VARAILWLRRDLRLDDLPALSAAAAAGPDGVLVLFVLDPALLHPAGPSRRRFLAGALRALDEELGGRLVLRRGDPRSVVPAAAREVDAHLVAVTADFGPHGAARDAEVAAALAAQGRELLALDSSYGVAPGTLRTASGSRFRVYTPFRRALEAAGGRDPVPRVAASFMAAPSDASLGGDLDQGLAVPGAHGLPDWWDGLPLGAAATLPPAGPRAAAARLEAFVAGPLERYASDRDRPALAGTSRLSADLHFGCLHPRTVIAALPAGEGAARVRDELAWRDFHADVLWHHPASARRSLLGFGERLRYDDGPLARERFAAWAKGATGYPLVDAGMRQLLAEGWMHNRVRMVTASFLVKDLHLDWRLGARWFMWHLVDGDLASNQHGWQWVAGTGTDAAPFHRILNPELQRERFDPDGSYVQRYLAGSPAYAPIVEHAHERREALARFQAARDAAAPPP
jgi:deoxyribodipyrimidine photo-lyase